MKLTRRKSREREAWEKAGINLPGYDVEAVTEKAKRSPGWVHFGIGNIFRVFIGGIADGLLEGVLDRGITCVETFDYDVVDKIYAPYDSSSPNVILHGDGEPVNKVLGALAGNGGADHLMLDNGDRLKEILRLNPCSWFPSLSQKGLCTPESRRNMDVCEADIKNGPDKATEQWQFLWLC